MSIPKRLLRGVAGVLPGSIEQRLRWLLKEDLRASFSLADYLRLCELTRLRGQSIDSAPVPITVKSLGNAVIPVRSGTSDASVLIETFFGRFHLPPDGMNPRRIWDLGANIGLTAAHFAALYPQAKVTAVEPEPLLAKLAKANTDSFGGRVEIVVAAVWPVKESLLFCVQHGDEYGGKVSEGESGISVQGRPLNDLMSDDDQVDYLKMDIEGAEFRVLKEATEWADKVRCIRVEVHGDYTVTDCVSDLNKLGFQASVDAHHWAGVLGIK